MDPFQRTPPSEAVTELRRLLSSIDFANSLDELRPIFYRADGISKHHPDNDEVQSVVNDIKRRIASRGTEIKQGAVAAPPPPPPPPPPPSSIFVPPTPDSLPTVEIPAAAPPPPPPPMSMPPRVPTPDRPFAPPMSGAYQRAATRPQPPTRTPTAQQPMAAPPPPPPPKKSVVPLLAIGGILWACVLGGGAYWFFKIRNATPDGMVSVEFATVPPGAAVRINSELRGNSNLKVDLPPGDHKLEVVLDGYEPAVSTVKVGPGAPASVSLNLVPRPQTIRFYTDLAEGSVTLDGNPVGQLQQGQLVLDGVALGAHTVLVKGGVTEVSFSFELAPGRAPKLTSTISAKDILAVIVSNAGKQAFANSSRVPMKVGLDTQAAGVIGQDGLTLENIAAGDHELTVGEGSDARKVVVSFGPSPVLTAFLKLNLNKGTLIVVTGEDDVSLLLNDRPYPYKTKRGMIRIPNLDVYQYRVALAKDGFERPSEQVAVIRKGEETRLEFTFKPIQRASALRVRGAPLGTTVFLDGASIGAVGADGSLSAGNVTPGDHVIEFRRDRHQTRTMRRTFSAGATVEVGDSDVAMEKTPATLKLQTFPPESRVVLKPAGGQGGSETVIRDSTITVPEGSWTISASAPNFTERRATFQVAAGEVVTVDLRLTRIAGGAKSATAARPIGMEGWDQPGHWTQQGQWLAQRGGNFVTFANTPVNGAFSMTVARLRGGRLQWVVNFKNDRNYALLQMDDDDFWRKLVVDGRTRDLVKVKHGADKKLGYFQLMIEVSNTSLTHKIYKDNAWTTFDNWVVNNLDLSEGKFGFYIPGGDQVGLSNFTYSPR